MTVFRLTKHRINGRPYLRLERWMVQLNPPSKMEWVWTAVGFFLGLSIAVLKCRRLHLFVFHSLFAPTIQVIYLKVYMHSIHKPIDTLIQLQNEIILDHLLHVQWKQINKWANVNNFVLSNSNCRWFWFKDIIYHIYRCVVAMNQYF